MPRLLRFAIAAAGLMLVLAGGLWGALESDKWGDQIVAPPYENLTVALSGDGTAQVVGSLGETWVEPVGDEVWVVLRSVEGADPKELFRGPQEDAQAYRELEAVTVLVEGTEAEVDAWIADHRRGAQLLGPVLLAAAGAAVVLVGLLAGRRRPAALPS